MNSHIRFHPRVGERYQEACYGARLMVLGESHYVAEGKADGTLTSDVLEWCFSPTAAHEPWMNTFVKFARALAGREVTRQECRSIYDGCLFYNYVQMPLQGPRQTPTREQWMASAAAFYEVLNAYRPQKVLVWGHRLWQNMPADGHKGEPVMGHDTWVYEYGNGWSVECLEMTHPSAAFAPLEWHEVIEKFLKRL